jgi:hypothetical protein
VYKEVIAMVSLERTKAEIEKYLQDAKANGKTEIGYSFFFSALPYLRGDMADCDHKDFKPKNWISHLEITTEPPESNDFRLFHLGVYPYDERPSEVWETRDWFFKTAADLDMTIRDSHEQIELEVEGLVPEDLEAAMTCEDYRQLDSE